MSEVKFEREPRYLVIKLSKLDGGYASGCIYPDAKLAKKIEKLAGSALVDCVVVEADWPEYEPVWGMLERRTTGQPASDFDAQRLRADTAEAELADMQHWRDLALQFDNHRMTALGHLRAIVRCSDRDLLTSAEEFLKAPPLAAHEVVAKLAAAELRIADLKSALEGMLEYFPEGNSDGECFSVEAARAALNQKSEGESHGS